jgi:subtilisin family serine protease
MHAVLARRVVSVVAAAVAVLQLPASASAATSTTAPSHPQALSAAAGHLPAAFHEAARSQLRSRSSSGTRSYQGTSPPNPCYYSLWSDPQGDAPELDAGSYGAVFDCPSATWAFPVGTYDTWPSSELDFFAIDIDSDGNLTNHCNGVDWELVGAWDPASSQLTSGLFKVVDCNTNPTLQTLGGISRGAANSLTITIPNAAMGNPPNIRWFAGIKGINEANPDLIPDSGQSAHDEDGYLGGGCTTQPQGSTTPASYTVVDDAPAAAAVLAASGHADARAAHVGAGVVRFSGDPVAAMAALASHGIKATVSPDRRLSYAATPNDPSYSSQWSLAQVNAGPAWDVTTGSAAVIVADLDSGVDPTHPDLAGKLVAGYDATTQMPLSTTTSSDPNGHGTATAGVIGAATNNANQLASLGWSTSVMPVKVGDASGVTSSDEATGLHWAADHGAKVINLSLGSPCTDSNEQNAISYAQGQGALIVAAAGNDAANGDRPFYPAALPGVLAVGATGADGNVAGYSNFGSYVDLVAPGGSDDGNAAHDLQLLAPGGGLATGAGTSFAAPMVSAAAGLLLAVNPNLSAASMRSLLTDTATDIGPAGRDSYSGFGRLNAALAVQTAALRAKFNAMSPTRILDTRDGTGGPGGAVGPGETRLVQVAGANGGAVPANGVSAVVMNVTAVSPTNGSFLTVFPSGVARPLASNLNFSAGQVIPNLVVVRLGSDGKVAVFNAVGSVHVIFDVVGWYGSTGDGYNAVTPARILDTRDGTGSTASPLGPGEVRSVKVTGAQNVPSSGVSAVVMNVTAVSPTAGSYLTIYPSDVARPLASNLNFPPGAIIPNLVVVKVGSDGNVDLYNAQGNVHVLFDVVGWYGSTGSSLDPLPPQRVLDTRDGTGSSATPIGAGATRVLKVAGVGGVPSSGVSAVIINVTATGGTAGSYLTVFPSDVSRPLASNLNFAAGQDIPNLVMVKLGADGSVGIYNAQGAVNVVADVVGWYT